MSNKILIVDDEPKMLRLLGIALEREGYQIAIAQDGEETFRKIEIFQPDLVILDVMLPGISGLEICQRIRATPETMDLPVIMLSALAQTTDKILGLEAGADEYVTKPVDLAEMIARIAALIQRTERLRKRPAVKEGVVISFIGAKGGVGTTTIVLNVAVDLVRRGNSVVAVELHPYLGTFPFQLGLTAYGHLGDLLGLEPGKIDEHELTKRLSKHRTGIQVLCAPKDIVGEEIKPGMVDVILNVLTGMADYVLIDLPHHPSDACKVVLEKSSSVALVLETSTDSISAGKAMLAFIRAHAVVASPIGIVVVNRQGLVSSMSPSEIESQLECRVITAVPRASDALANSYRTGQPLVVSQPESIASVAMTELTGVLAGKKPDIGKEA